MVARLRAGPLRTLIRSLVGYIFIFYKRHKGDLGPIQLPIKFIKEDLSPTRGGGGGHAVAQLVEAMRNKPEGLGFDFRWCHYNFSLT
jgi:hypothetical protein